MVFVTDGEPTVGERNPDAIAALAARQRGDARVFAVGVSADVNATLIEQLAVEGHGTAHFVRDSESVERTVSLLARRLSTPVLTNVRLRVDGVRLSQVLPAGALDVFAGQDLVVLARYNGDGRATVLLEGESADGPVTWSTQASFPAQSRENPFVARLWAAQRVGWLAAEKRKRGSSTEMDAEIRSLGERYGIPTEFSSYLVVEPGMQVAANNGRVGERQDVVVTGSATAASEPGRSSARARGTQRPMPPRPPRWRLPAPSVGERGTLRGRQGGGSAARDEVRVGDGRAVQGRRRDGAHAGKPALCPRQRGMDGCTLHCIHAHRDRETLLSRRTSPSCNASPTSPPPSPSANGWWWLASRWRSRSSPMGRGGEHAGRGGDRRHRAKLVTSQMRDDELERLFKLYHTPLVRYLTRRLGDRDWADEVAQETFLRALRQDALTSERSWLFAVRDQPRARPGPQGRTPAPAPATAGRRGTGPGGRSRITTSLERAQEGAMARQAVDALAERDRLALLMREEGLDYNEIAEALGLSVGVDRYHAGARSAAPGRDV